MITTSTIIINSQELKSLKESPKTLIHKESKFVIPMFISLKYTFGSAPYDISGSDLRILVGNYWIFPEIGWKFVAKNENAFFYECNTIMPMDTKYDDYFQNNITLSNVGSQNISAGDGELKIKIVQLTDED